MACPVCSTIAMKEGVRVLAEAIRRTYGDRSILWRVPLLTAVSLTGFGLILLFGYGLALQGAIFDGETESPDVDLDHIWYGLKYMIVLLVLALPVIALVGGIAVPAFLEISKAAITAPETLHEVEAAVMGKLWLFGGLSIVWLALFLLYLPASMAAFDVSDGSIVSGVSPLEVFGFVRAAKGGYAEVALVVLGWLAGSALLYVPVELLTPTGSVAPTLVLIFVVIPGSISVFLLIQALLAEIRRKMAAQAGEILHGWEHLERAARGDQDSEKAGDSEEEPGPEPKGAPPAEPPEARDTEGEDEGVAEPDGEPQREPVP